MQNQPNQEVQADEEIARLETLLEESVAAEQFFQTASGRLLEQLIIVEINRSLAKISGDDFKKDHTGYINELAWLQANKRLLRKLQVAASPVRREKIMERIEMVEGETGNGRKTT